MPESLWREREMIKREAIEMTRSKEDDYTMIRSDDKIDD